MMKNKHLVLFTLAGLWAIAMVGCKPYIDVEETCKDIAHTTLLGTDSVQAGVFVDGYNTRVVEYRFLPDQKATRTEMVFGDGVYEPAQAVNMSYLFTDYAEGHAGFHVLFTPEDANVAPYTALFLEGNLAEDNYVLSETRTFLAPLQTVITTLPNTAWEYHDTTLLVNITITKYMDTTINKTVTPNGIVRDTVITEKTKEERDTLGNECILDIQLALDRDKDTYANTGVWEYKFLRYKVNADKTGAELAESADKRYTITHWGINSIATDQKFVVKAQTDNAEESELTLSFGKFRPDKGSTDLTYTNQISPDSVATNKLTFTIK